MSIKYKFDVEKAIEVILYITEQVTDIYAALKVLYFADKKHLAEYGRFICGDSYVAMSHGPVPSGAYDLVKFARGDGFCWWKDISIKEAFVVQDTNIIPQRKANPDYLSESDMECLDTAIKDYGYLPFHKLKQLSHDTAYKSAGWNDFISIEAIAKTLPNADLLLDYLQND